MPNKKRRDLLATTTIGVIAITAVGIVITVIPSNTFSALIAVLAICVAICVASVAGIFAAVLGEKKVFVDVIALVTVTPIRALGAFLGLSRPRSAITETRRSLRSSRAVTGASRLLPVEVRDEYHEEWAAWMSDLRADGTPRVRRWIELLTIVLIAAPRLAVTLRAAARRAVD
ncbi:hypothetical protein ACTG9Q_20425 [Actinokineospora sp. 24-640]